MQMASPQNQEEYDNLGSLLQYFNDPWNSVTIAGYRSEENEQDWVVNDVNINYEINWNDGEPNNGGSGEYCLGELLFFSISYPSYHYKKRSSINFDIENMIFQRWKTRVLLG